MATCDFCGDESRWFPQGPSFGFKCKDCLDVSGHVLIKGEWDDWRWPGSSSLWFRKVKLADGWYVEMEKKMEFRFE